MKWERVRIKADNGEIKEGIAPLIISASRATDIPAFHAKWFMNRLEKGYIKWENPFNRSKPMYVSLENVRLIVFWTKNPEPIIPLLNVLEDKEINYYFQYTLNDYENENFEPAIPSLEERLKIFCNLSEQIGKERVIWRFDPLLLSETISVNDLLLKIRKVGDKLVNHTNKLVFSFADVFNYRKVKANLIKESSYFTIDNIHLAEFTQIQKVEMARELQKLLSEWKKVNPDFTIATCAEDIDLKQFGIEHNKCIDDELIIQLFSNDSELMNFIGYEPTLFEQSDIQNTTKRNRLKDQNQRPSCGCIYSKDIGAYNTCDHLCVYCYANLSRERVVQNLKELNSESDNIIG